MKQLFQAQNHLKAARVELEKKHFDKAQLFHLGLYIYTV